MNILMALSQLEITGAEVYATTIADELIERGNKVYIKILYVLFFLSNFSC